MCCSWRVFGKLAVGFENQYRIKPIARVSNVDEFQSYVVTERYYYNIDVYVGFLIKQFIHRQEYMQIFIHNGVFIVSYGLENWGPSQNKYAVLSV